MKNLYLIRHAKSDWSDGSKSDFERGLNIRGKKSISIMAKALKEKKIMPELKIILITGYEDSIKEDSIKGYDIAEIIMKPLILSEFSKTIRNVLDAKAKKSA